MTQEPHRNTILMASFWIWYSLLSFPLMLTDSDNVDSPPDHSYLYQLAGFLQYAVVAVSVHRSRIFSSIIRCDNFQFAVIVIIVLSFGLQLHGDGISILAGIAYTIVLTIAITLLSLIWTMKRDALVKCLGGAALVLSAFAVSAVVFLGLPEGRHVGGIHPNLFGAVLLSAFIFSQFREGTTMVVLRVLCFILVASISSRFALIGCLIALLVFETTYNPISVRLVLLAGLAAGCLVLFSQQFNELLALNDPARNLDSGFTGRSDLWKAAFEAMANNPIGVGFKRPTLEDAGHNGYLKTLLEFGVFGGGLMIVAVLGIVVVALVKAVLPSEEDDRLRRIASARAAGLVALAFATFFQPQMFNLGDVHGISFILLLFSPGVGVGQPVRLSSRAAQPIGIGAGK